MPGVTKSVLVPFSAQKMYDLVVNCEDYPAFLPWCAGGRILEQKGDELSAELKINFKGIQQSFSTRNRNVPGKSIEMALLSGPFKSLRGHWRLRRWLKMRAEWNSSWNITLPAAYWRK